MSEFAEHHDELRRIARDLLVGGSPGEDVRRDALAEAGWLGLEVPPELDGAGATFAELAVVLQEVGRAAAHSTILGSIVLGVGALTSVEPDPGRDDRLRRVARGELDLAVAVHDGGVDAVGAAPAFRIEREDGRILVFGSAAFVPDALDAGLLLLVAADGVEGPALVEVAPDASGLCIVGQPVLDTTRRLASIAADGVEVQPAAVRRFRNDPTESVRRLFDRAAVAVALDSLGASEAMLEATVDYVAQRRQFGRPVGSFQAVKHGCADMQVSIAVGRELCAAAIARLVADDPDASVAASMACSYLGTSAVEIAGAAMQFHGGIGYTWESGIHVYLKRAALNRSLFGSPASHRRELGKRYAS